MSSEKTHFVIGIVLGVLVSAVFFYYFAPRYETVKEGQMMVKQDRWTGRSWRFSENEWRPIVGVNRDWEKIDRALLDALRISVVNFDMESALKSLREKNPVLQDITREELLERIKLVYSRQVLVNLYLENYLKTEAGK